MSLVLRNSGDTAGSQVELAVAVGAFEDDTAEGIADKGAAAAVEAYTHKVDKTEGDIDLVVVACSDERNVDLAAASQNQLCSLLIHWPH